MLTVVLQNTYTKYLGKLESLSADSVELKVAASNKALIIGEEGTYELPEIGAQPESTAPTNPLDESFTASTDRAYRGWTRSHRRPESRRTKPVVPAGAAGGRSLLEQLGQRRRRAVQNPARGGTEHVRGVEQDQPRPVGASSAAAAADGGHERIVRAGRGERKKAVGRSAGEPSEAQPP
eukprot:792751-Prorocentrum_minimum.AAC.3